MYHFQPSDSQHLVARRNEAAKGTPSLLDQFNSWVTGIFAPAATPKAPPKPGEPAGPGTPDGRAVEKGTAAYTAILAELDKKYGKFPANAVGYRDSVGDGNYVYRQYSDGRLYIQVSGYGKTPVAPKVVAANTIPTTGGGLPPWVLPVSIVGGAAVIGAGIYFWPKIRAKMKRR